MARRLANTPPLGISTPEFLQAWSDWMEHLRQRCRKVTQKQIEIHTRKCVALGSARAVAAIEYSIERSYSAIYEPPVPIQQKKADAAESRREVIMAEGNARKGDKDEFEAELAADNAVLAAIPAAELAAFVLSLRHNGRPLSGMWRESWTLRRFVAREWQRRLA